MCFLKKPVLQKLNDLVFNFVRDFLGCSEVDVSTLVIFLGVDVEIIGIVEKVNIKRAPVATKIMEVMKLPLTFKFNQIEVINQLMNDVAFLYNGYI